MFYCGVCQSRKFYTRALFNTYEYTPKYMQMEREKKKYGQKRWRIFDPNNKVIWFWGTRNLGWRYSNQVGELEEENEEEG